MFGTFDAIPKRKHITFFKLGKLWVFKQLFDNRMVFKCVAGLLQQRPIPFRVQIDWREE